MAHKQTLFSATFEESKRIVPNMFTTKNTLDVMGNVGSYKLRHRLIALLVLCLGSMQMWVYGVGFTREMPESGDVHFMTLDVFRGITLFNKIEPILILSICLPIFICVINLLPLKNYKYRKIVVVIFLILFILEFLITLMPLCLGIPLGALGWLGFTIGNIYGLTFFLVVIKSQIDEIKEKLYPKQSKINLKQVDKMDTTGVNKIWSVLKKYSVLALSIIVVNVLVFRIGMWGERTIWSIWGIGIIIYWIITLFSFRAIISMSIKTFYFVKYAEQYRQLWKATDEQWYGPRKAKKLAKKKKNHD